MHQKYIQYFSFFFWFIYTLNLPTFCTLLYSLCTSAKLVCYIPFIYRFSHKITLLIRPCHLQADSPHQFFPWDTGLVMNHRQRSHLRLTSTFKLGWNCLQLRYVWEFSLSLISMEIRCRAEPHPTGAAGFDLYKYALFLYLCFLFLPAVNVGSFLLIFCLFDTSVATLLLRPDHPALSGGKSHLFLNINNSSPLQACSSEQRLQHKSFLSLGWQFSSPKGLEKWERTSQSMRMRIRTKSGNVSTREGF